MRSLKKRPRNLNEYIFNLSNSLKENKKLHTARNLKSALSNLEKFKDEEAIEFQDINANFIKDYESFLENKDISKDTVSFYMRTFKIILNHASNDGLISYAPEWFETVNTNAYRRTEKTLQKALDLSIVKKLSNLDLSGKPKLDMARDLFMFSFYMQGMELSDILNLKKDNIVNGCIVFKRRQVGHQKTIPLTGKALAIVAKHLDEKDTSLFPLKVGYNVPSLKNVPGCLVRYLLAVGELIDCPKLSFSQARATWLSLTSQVNLADRLTD